MAYTWLGVVVALTLIGLPFVVRSVQPALMEVQRDLEEAAETLGARTVAVFRRIILPAVFPALLTGFTLASRAASASTVPSCSSPATCRSRRRSRHC